MKYETVRAYNAAFNNARYEATHVLNSSPYDAFTRAQNNLTHIVWGLCEGDEQEALNDYYHRLIELRNELQKVIDEGFNPLIKRIEQENVISYHLCNKN